MRRASFVAAADPIVAIDVLREQATFGTEAIFGCAAHCPWSAADLIVAIDVLREQATFGSEAIFGSAARMAGFRYHGLNWPRMSVTSVSNAQDAPAFGRFICYG